MTNPITLTIDEQGDMLCIVNDGTRAFIGEDAVIRRASHVEPDNAALRVAFHALRHAFGDKGWMAGFTRLWPCLWRINTAPIGGGIFPQRYKDRQAAIDAEIAWLNHQFLYDEVQR